MSVVSGIMGSNAQTKAANTAADAQRDATNKQVDEAKRQYDQTRGDFAPYMKAGYSGLGQIQGMDLMQGVGDAPSYDEVYTNQLGNYQQSEGYQAQNALGQEALQRQLNARGLNYGATGASAGAELSQKLTATDFDKYRSGLSDKYKALQGEYAQRRDVNQNKYNQLLDLVKVGQGAAASTGQAGNAYTQQAQNAYSQLGAANAQAALQSGQAQAGMWGGIGQTGVNAVGAGLKAYDWYSKGGAGASGGAAGTMVSANAPAYSNSWETTGSMGN